jgi:hypothetical protein
MQGELGAQGSVFFWQAFPARCRKDGSVQTKALA